MVSSELDEVARIYGDARRTEIRSDSGEVKPISAAKAANVSAELADTECFITVTASGLIARSSISEPAPEDRKRQKHDAVLKRLATSTRKDLGFVTSSGRMIRIHVGDVPAMSDVFDPSSAIPANEFLGLKDETIVGVFDISTDTELFLGTKFGVVKRVAADYPSKDDFELISLKDGDEVIGASVASDAVECIFITGDAQLLRFDASVVRAQGRAASGVAGINLSNGANAIHFSAIQNMENSWVVTCANSSDSLPGTDAGSTKVSALSEFPAKGRATGGVRAHKFVRNEDQLFFATVTEGTPLASAKNGAVVELPEPSKRDASGTPSTTVIAGVGSR